MTLHVDFETETRVAGPAAVAGTVLPEVGESLYRDIFKRLFDIAFVLATSFVTLPLVALMAILIARDGHSPFYLQDRLGKGGRHFRMWKLRSMRPDADTLLQEVLAADPEARREWDATQKLKNDPRVTRIGRFIRKGSLDELPQFWNVLIGDMSIVGPRPMMTEQRALYPGGSYFEMRPGVTGPWQVSDRNATEFSARADYDDRYFREMSFWTDSRIVLRTALVVARGTGY